MLPNIGVKFPDTGTPDSVEGMLIRGDGEGDGVGLGVAFGLGVGEGVASVAEGLAEKDGKSLSPAARTVKALLVSTVCPDSFFHAIVIVWSPGSSISGGVHFQLPLVPTTTSSE